MLSSAAVRGDSLLGALHPFTKIVLVGGGMCVALAADEARLPLWAWLGAVLLAAADSGVLRLLVTILFRSVLPLLVSLFAVNTLLGLISGELPWRGDLWLLAASAMGHVDVLGLRIVVCVSSMLLLIATMPPGQLVVALARAGAPPWIGHVVAATLLLLPATVEQAASIAEAQRARGLCTGRGTPLQRLRSSLALTVPLVLSLLQAAEDQAKALDARGFSRVGPRTSYAAVAELDWEPRARRVYGLLVIYLGGWLRGWWPLLPGWLS